LTALNYRFSDAPSICRERDGKELDRFVEALPPGASKLATNDPGSASRVDADELRNVIEEALNQTNSSLDHPSPRPLVSGLGACPEHLDRLTGFEGSGARVALAREPDTPAP
jgi:hypothetical protein